MKNKTMKNKLRAWDKEKKCFLYNNEFVVNGDGDVFRNDCASMSENDRFVVQRFTGWLDKNRTPIYEGDIVSYKDYKDWGDTEEYITSKIVIYSDEAAAFGVIPLNKKHLYGFTPIFYFRGVEEAVFEVTGHIFDKTP